MVDELVTDLLNLSSISNEKISKLIGHIVSVTKPTDSCGEVANHICGFFFEEKEAEKLKYADAEKKNFTKIPKEAENEKLINDIKASLPCFTRIEIGEERRKDNITQSHSYCTFSFPDKKCSLATYVYQAYFGGYTIFQWINDVKFKKTPFREHFNELILLNSADKDKRKAAYGRLYRLTDTEEQTPPKTPLHIYYRVVTIDLKKAAQLIKAKKRELETLKADFDARQQRPDYYLITACFEFLLLKSVNIVEIKRRIMQYIEEMNRLGLREPDHESILSYVKSNVQIHSSSSPSSDTSSSSSSSSESLFFQQAEDKKEENDEKPLKKAMQELQSQEKHQEQSLDDFTTPPLEGSIPISFDDDFGGEGENGQFEDPIRRETASASSVASIVTTPRSNDNSESSEGFNDVSLTSNTPNSSNSPSSPFTPNSMS